MGESRSAPRTASARGETGAGDGDSANEGERATLVERWV
jgi:hypothetical protein